MADPPRVCPECGEPATARWPVAVSLWPKRKMIPVAVVLLAAVTLGIWLWRTSETVGVTSGTPMPRLLTPPVSPDELERIAKGELVTGGSLAESLLGATAWPLHQPGVAAIDVGWAPAPNTVGVGLQRGWPAPWRSRWEMRWYEDPAARTGFLPGATDETLDRLPLNQGVSDVRRVPPRDRFAWNGATLHHRPPPEVTGGAYISETFNLFTLLWPLAVAIVVWCLGSVALLIARLIRRRREPRRLRRLVRVAAVIAAALMLGLLLISSKRVESGASVWVNTVEQRNWVSLGQVFRTLEGYARLPVMRDNLAQRAANADTDASLAKMILDAAPAPAADEPLFLAAAPAPEAILAGATYRSFSPKLRLLRIQNCRWERRGDFGAVEPLPAPFRLYYMDYSRSLAARWGSGPGRGNVTEVSLAVEIALAIIVALWLVWLIARTAAGIALAITARRRRRGGQCVACGYG